MINEKFTSDDLSLAKASLIKAGSRLKFVIRKQKLAEAYKNLFQELNIYFFA